MEDTNVVTKAAPFHFTFAPETKPAPVTVIMVAAPPTVAVPGLRVVKTGGGLVTVNAAVLLDPPPGAGLTTAMLNAPSFVRSLAGTVAVSSVGDI